MLLTLSRFFHQNVGLSAWGLAIHKESRYIAVSSNLQEITVFVLELDPNKKYRYEEEPEESWCPMPDFYVESDGWKAVAPEEYICNPTGKYLPREQAAFRLVFDLDGRGHNIPYIAFADAEDGTAQNIIATDIAGNIWDFDIFNRTGRQILRRNQYHDHNSRCNHFLGEQFVLLES
jgi:hypothetical protein